MPRIQIWSNLNGSQFALRLNTDIADTFRAVTKEGERYVKIVEEAEYLHDMKYEWDYTLRYWVNAHYNNKHHIDASATDSNRISTTIINEIKRIDDPLSFHHTTNDDHSNSIFSEENQNDYSTSIRRELLLDKEKTHGRKKKSSGRLKLKLKCHYCGLMFYDEKQRTGHEKEWHADKVGKGQ